MVRPGKEHMQQQSDVAASSPTSVGSKTTDMATDAAADSSNPYHKWSLQDMLKKGKELHDEYESTHKTLPSVPLCIKLPI